MKLVYVADDQETKTFPDGDGYTVTTLKYDVKRMFPSLQALVEKIAAERDFDGIVVSAKLGNELEYMGLEFAMRVRLSWSTIKEKAFTSLFIYTPELPEEIYKRQTLLMERPTATVLPAIGTFIFKSIGSFGKLACNPANYNLLNTDNFERLCLNVIRVNKPAELGNHSLANLLGVLRLAAITGNNAALAANAYVARFSHDLYVKYKTDFKNGTGPVVAERSIASIGRKVLLIDDNEHHGWTDVLSKIFEAGVLHTVPSGKDFIARAEAEILKPDWDLILLDLRLEDSEDQGEVVNKPAAAFSGARLLESIKKANRGSQVILFTASSKAWIMRDLIMAPYYADGYFVKESPDVTFDESFTRYSYLAFVKQVRECFSRWRLKDLVHKVDFIKANLAISLTIAGQGTARYNQIVTFEGAILSKMQTALEIVSTYTPGEVYKLRLAFLQLYQCLEDYSKLDFIYRRVGNIDSVIRKNGTLANVVYPDPGLGGGFISIVKFNRGRYCYQNAMVLPKLKSVEFKHDSFTDDDASPLLRMITIFKERHGFSIPECNELIEFTFLRSNLCGHLTGNIDINRRDIMMKDLVEITAVIEKIITTG